MFDVLQMICQANQNGSQVECDLGNPVKRNAKVENSFFYLVLWMCCFLEALLKEIWHNPMKDTCIMTTIEAQTRLKPLSVLQLYLHFISAKIHHQPEYIKYYYWDHWAHCRSPTGNVCPNNPICNNRWLTHEHFHLFNTFLLWLVDVFSPGSVNSLIWILSQLLLKLW